MITQTSWLIEQQDSDNVLPVWQKLVNLMAELCQTPAGFIVQMTEQGYQVVIANQSEANPYAAGAIVPSEVNIFCRKVVEEQQCLYVGNATELNEWQSNPEVTDDGFNSYLGFPLLWPDGNPFGTICVMDFAKTDYDEKYYKLLEHFKEMAERELSLLHKTIQLEQLSFHDELTQVLNRRGLKAAVKGRIELAMRHDECLNICFFDLDKLKLMNDQFGHEFGDKVIRLFAQTLKDCVRENDLVVRLGGDEFVALIFLKSHKDLTVVLERINHRVKHLVDEVVVTYSLGIEAVDAQDLPQLSVERAIDNADRAMYVEKEAKA